MRQSRIKRATTAVGEPKLTFEDVCQWPSGKLSEAERSFAEHSDAVE